MRATQAHVPHAHVQRGAGLGLLQRLGLLLGSTRYTCGPSTIVGFEMVATMVSAGIGSIGLHRHEQPCLAAASMPCVGKLQANCMGSSVWSLGSCGPDLDNLLPTISDATKTSIKQMVQRKALQTMSVCNGVASCAWGLMDGDATCRPKMQLLQQFYGCPSTVTSGSRRAAPGNVASVAVCVLVAFFTAAARATD